MRSNKPPITSLLERQAGGEQEQLSTIEVSIVGVLRKSMTPHNLFYVKRK